MFRLPKEDRAGIYTTVIVHLAVVIVLLLAGLGTAIRPENSFVLDFSKLEEKERIQQEEERLREEAEFKESIRQKLDRQLATAPAVRGVAVDRAALRDDRGTDAEQLYRDAERLAAELAKGYEVKQEDFADPNPQTQQTQPEPKKEEDGVVAHFAVYVDDVDAAAAELQALGIDTFLKPEKTVLPELFGGLENRFFRGPSGEQIELLHCNTFAYPD